jgi:hypothetical protein
MASFSTFRCRCSKHHALYLATLNQTDLTIENALRTWRAIDAMNDAAAKREQSGSSGLIQLGVSPAVRRHAGIDHAPVGAQSLTPQGTGRGSTANDPGAYHAEVRDAVIDAMLDHGLPLRLKPNSA